MRIPVIAFIDHMAASADLLWQLIAIAAKSQVRLRSDEGEVDRNSLEAAIVDLPLQDSPLDSPPAKKISFQVGHDRTKEIAL